MFSRKDAGTIASFLRALADRIEAEPEFVNQVFAGTPTPKDRPGQDVGGQSLIERYHHDGAVAFRGWLEGQDVAALRSLVATGRFDTTGKVRRWKDKAKLVEFLHSEVERRSKFGRSILPVEDSAAPAQEPADPENNG